MINPNISNAKDKAIHLEKSYYQYKSLSDGQYLHAIVSLQS